MATNGILLRQNNNNEESLKKEVFFISDPITLNYTYDSTIRNSIFSSITLPIEKMKEYSWIKLGVYDGQCSYQITRGTGESYIIVKMSYGAEEDFYFLNNFDYNDRTNSFDFQKAPFAHLFVWRNSNQSKKSFQACFPWSSSSFSLEQNSNLYCSHSGKTYSNTDYISFNVRLYLEGIK